MSCAPIAVFTYNRPEHTRRLLASLSVNPEVAGTRVCVFSDAPREPAHAPLVAATREVIHRAPIPHLEIVERPTNFGLAGNIVDGVTSLCGASGRAIVLEDDLVVSPTFLAFMNAALERYQHAEPVMHVSGYMFPLRLPRATGAVFLPFINVSGWATWAHAWRHFDEKADGYQALVADAALRRRFDLDGSYYFFRMLEQYRAGQIKSWAIRWYLTLFLKGGLAVYPAQSLVENRGYDAAGTHTTAPLPPPHGRARAHAFRAGALPEPAVDPITFARVRRLMARELAIPYRARTKLSRVWRAVVTRARLGVGP
jgi:hypothetical protein